MPIPLPTIANTFRVALNWTEIPTGQTAVNVIHIKQRSGSPTAFDAWTALSAAVVSGMWLPVANTARVTKVQITPLDGTSATEDHTPEVAGEWEGQADGQFVPQVAGLVKLQTPLRGRNHRGRVFLPFISELVLANGVWSGLDVTAWTAGWQEFVSNMVAETGEWDLGVASYDRAHGGAGAVFTGVSDVSGEAIPATQRRRQSRLRGA
jgi:hypothetical protein